MTSKTSRHSRQQLANAERLYAEAFAAHAAAREAFEAASAATDVAVCRYGYDSPERREAWEAYKVALSALRAASDEHALATVRLDRCQDKAGV